MKNKLLVIGAYERDYPRTNIIVDVFREYFDLEQMNFESEKHKILKFLYWIFVVGRKRDYILIPKEAQSFGFVVAVFKLFNPRVKIIFDAFISFYDTKVLDRRLVSKKSLKARYYFLLDFIMCKFSDVMFFDTKEHMEYFVKTFHINKKKKLFVLPMAVDIDLIDGVEIGEATKDHFKEDKYNIFFYGSYIPLQGIEYIIEAANNLKDNKGIHFLLLGGGQTFAEIKKLCEVYDLKNVSFVGRKPYKELLEFIKASDLCLGIFGHSEKAKRVVSNKVLEYACCKKPIISGRTRAMERFFKDYRDILYCNMADAEDLAKKIEMMYNDKDSLTFLGENSRRKVEEFFSEKSIVSIIRKNGIYR